MSIVGGGPIYSEFSGNTGQAKLKELARKGDAFEYVATDGSFYRVYGPAGEHRWIPVKNAALKQVFQALPADEALLRSAFNDITAAQDRSQELSDQEMPPETLQSIEDIKRMTVLQRVLNDELVLQAMHRRGLDPIIQGAITTRGVSQGWPMD